MLHHLAGCRDCASRGRLTCAHSVTRSAQRCRPRRCRRSWTGLASTRDQPDARRVGRVVARRLPPCAGGLALGDCGLRRHCRDLGLDAHALRDSRRSDQCPTAQTRSRPSTRTSGLQRVTSIFWRLPQVGIRSRARAVERRRRLSGGERPRGAGDVVRDARARGGRLVGALQDAMTFQGRTVALNRMSPQRRRLAESLLTEISRYRTTAPIPQGPLWPCTRSASRRRPASRRKGP